MSSTNTVLHLIDTAATRWSDADIEWYRPSLYDTDGFIHLSGTDDLMLWVANRFYVTSADPLYVWTIDTARLRADLRWEAASPPAPETEGVLFPHLYGDLNLDAVVATRELARDDTRFVGYGPSLS